MGCVYFFKHNNSKYVKIGMSRKDKPDERFKTFLTYAPLGGEMLGYFRTSTPLIDEQEIHGILKDNRVYGEWFDVEHEQLNEFIKKYSQITKIKRLMFDVPFDIDEEDKSVLNLKCIIAFFSYLYLDTYNLSDDFLHGVLLKHSILTERELNNIDLRYIYQKYFEKK